MGRGKCGEGRVVIREGEKEEVGAEWNGRREV